MTVIPELPELPGTGGYRTTRHLPPEVLNSPPYVRPGATHTYPTTVSTLAQSWRAEQVLTTVTIVHVEGCHKLAQARLAFCRWNLTCHPSADSADCGDSETVDSRSGRTACHQEVRVVTM
ncbi:hypothetical protein ACIBQ1_60150 [Nonomuraea sp. NPDC050153]|uniref:hypothetical protein n=1 Tax=Nonomuraea sp. NPDC050153 TaxID=3364359 RepID=UPI0037BCE24C